MHSFALLMETKDKKLLDQALFHYRKRFSEEGLFENSVYPDVISSLQNLNRAGKHLFLATAKPQVFAKQILDHFGLSPFFKTIYGSELNGHLSDKGDLIAHILEAENLVLENTLMVGDRSHDIIGGQKNGIKTAWVSCGYGTADERSASKPDHIFTTVFDLAKFVTDG
jgi:phosphoglycolate phosphatase